jgi:hypothetical protein
MKTSWAAVALLAAATPGYPQAIPAPAVTSPAPADAAPTFRLPDDLNLLVGKKVIVGRMPLCVPNSYTAKLAYAGKPATVVSYTPNAALAENAVDPKRFPPNMRAMIDDARHGGKMTFRFEDGTLLDTCGDLKLSQFAANMQLTSGE